MADFKTHITVSTLAGVAYSVGGYRYGLPWESCAIAGGLCSVSGMLPDLDSDSGVPIREATSFASALVPALMVARLERIGVSHETMVLIAGGLYAFIRFVIAEIFRRYTVHRGMWHSLPAALAVGMLAFLICDHEDFNIRMFLTISPVLGFISHLVLDEIWAIDFQRGRYRFKSSFGSALKLWGNDSVANFTVYTQVLVLAILVYNDHGFMQRFDYRHPDVPHTAQQWFHQWLDEHPIWLDRK
jgi:hypothetical protein